MNIRTAIAAVVAMVLLVTLAFERSRQLDSNIAIDYYHFWGIGVARDRVRDDPYAGVKSYSETLNELVERSGSPHLRAANVWRRTIQPTGTPFFYAIVSWQPESFDVGYAEWKSRCSCMQRSSPRLSTGWLDSAGSGDGPPSGQPPWLH